MRKIDIATHLMPGFLPADQQDAASPSALLAPVYRHEDDLLGRLIEAARPARNVLVISDHGFELTEKGWDHQESAPDGIFVARGPAFEAGVTLDPVSVFDVAPTIPHVLGFPVADDMPGEVRNDALRSPPPGQDGRELRDRRVRPGRRRAKLPRGSHSSRARGARLHQVGPDVTPVGRDP